ncbi:MAG: DUF2017 family protein [Ilumatobacteraceae bacterium]
MNRFRGPVRRKGDRYVIEIGTDETALITRLVGELRALLTDPEPDAEASQLLLRLFPVAYPDDADMEAEYQRLMRDELVQSKLSAFDIIDEALTSMESLDEGRLVAVMQSINSIRLVLGNMLEVTDDPAIDEVDDEHEDSAEYALYSYLSWLLEWCVRALT